MDGCAGAGLIASAPLSGLIPQSVEYETNPLVAWARSLFVQMPNFPPSSDLTVGSDLPFVMGALYSRRIDIHERWGGQRQGGISTPKDAPFVFIFTGEAGKSHGYHDEWSEEDGLLDYFGEGQSGDMTMTAGNRAINRHVQDGKRLLVFKSLGHGKPYRFDGEFIKRASYVRPNTPATRGNNRNAIVFRLEPVDATPFLARKIASHRALKQSLAVQQSCASVRSEQNSSYSGVG